MGNNHSWYINKIVIDSREKVRGHHAYNYYVDKYDVEIKPLNYGDYYFQTNDYKQVIFEYKTCEDFIGSMENKTLFNELSNQTNNYEYSYLIVVGDFEKTFEYLYFNVPHYRYKFKTKRMLESQLTSQITGAFYRIYAMYIPIVFAKDENQAFQKMLKISFKIADAKKYGGIVRPAPKELNENPITFLLNGIKGIGEVKAKNITNDLHITCVDDLCEKKPSDFQSVYRVTDKNVREIWKTIHNEELDLD